LCKRCPVAKDRKVSSTCIWYANFCFKSEADSAVHELKLRGFPGSTDLRLAIQKKKKQYQKKQEKK